MRGIIEILSFKLTLRCYLLFVKQGSSGLNITIIIGLVLYRHHLWVMTYVREVFEALDDFEMEGKVCFKKGVREINANPGSQCRFSLETVWPGVNWSSCILNSKFSKLEMLLSPTFMFILLLGPTFMFIRMLSLIFFLLFIETITIAVTTRAITTAPDNPERWNYQLFHSQFWIDAGWCLEMTLKEPTLPNIKGSWDLLEIHSQWLPNIKGSWDLLEMRTAMIASSFSAWEDVKAHL